MAVFVVDVMKLCKKTLSPLYLDIVLERCEVEAGVGAARSDGGVRSELELKAALSVEVPSLWQDFSSNGRSSSKGVVMSNSLKLLGGMEETGYPAIS